MKRRLMIALAVLMPIVMVTTALAAYTAELTLTNSSGTNYEMLAANWSANVDYLADNGYFDTATGLDTRVRESGTERKHMLADDRIMAALPSNTGSTKTLEFSTNNTLLTSYPVIVGHTSPLDEAREQGYFYTADNSTMEISGNGTIEYDGYINTDVLTGEFDDTKYASYKKEAQKAYVNHDIAENFTWSLLGTPTNLIAVAAAAENATMFNNLADAYDSNTATGANLTEVPATSWSCFAQFAYGGGVFDPVEAYAITYYAEYDVASWTAIDVDYLDQDGAWVDVYEGVYANLTWETKHFTNPAVPRYTWACRVRFYNTNATSQNETAILREIALVADNETVSLSAIGVDNGETLIQTSIADRPDIDEYALTAQVGLPMGQGLIPGFVLEEQELTGAAASVTFSNIDDLIDVYEAWSGATARHLALIVNTASDQVANSQSVFFRFNSDSGNNYNYQTLYGENNISTASRSTGVSAMYLGQVPGTNYANSYGGGILLIPNAFGTTNHKATIYEGGAVESRVGACVGRWADASAIDTILIYPSAGNLISGSTFQLCVVDERYLVEEEYNAAADFLPDFNNIAAPTGTSNGTNLAIIGYCRSDVVAVSDVQQIEINADATATNYHRQYLYGTGATTGANSSSNNTFGRIIGDSATANAYGAFFAFISEFAEGTNDPTYLVLNGYHDSSVPQAEVDVVSGRRDNVAAITRVELYPDAGTNYVAGSMFSLYRVPEYVIQRTELAAPAASITIDLTDYQGYEAVQVHLYSRTDKAALTENIEINFNSDAVAANYDIQYIYGAIGAVGAARSAANNNWTTTTAATEGANEFGSTIYILPNYSKTDRHKHCIVIRGITENSIALVSSRWENNTGIQTIDLIPDAGGNFIAGTIVEVVGWMPHHVGRIDVDGAVYAIDDWNSYDMADSSYPWFFNMSNTFAYLDNTEIDIPTTATTVMQYQPNDIIEALTTSTARMYDRTANITATIVWGGVPSGVTTTTGAIVSDYSSTYINPNPTQDIAPIITPPAITSDAIKEAQLASDPFITAAETVEEITNNRLPVLLQYWWTYIVIGILLFIFIYAYFPNLILAGIGFCLPIGYGIAQGIFDFWVIIALALWLLGCVITEGRRLFA